MTPDPEKSPFFRQAAVLWAAGVLGTVAVTPYLTELLSEQFAKAEAETGLSLVVLAAIFVAQTAVLLGVAVVVGLWAARKVGLRAPVSEALVQRQPVGPVVKHFAIRSMVVGTATGVVVILLDLSVFQPLLKGAELPKVAEPALWKGALASLYGGIVEELLCRLFLLSVLALLLTWLSGTRDGLRPWAFWTANLLAALLFGVGHLPAAASLLPLTPVIVVRVLILNAVPGLVMDWLYRKRGLEAAMLAHGIADLILHVATPAIVGVVHDT